MRIAHPHSTPSSAAEMGGQLNSGLGLGRCGAEKSQGGSLPAQKPPHRTPQLKQLSAPLIEDSATRTISCCRRVPEAWGVQWEDVTTCKGHQILGWPNRCGPRWDCCSGAEVPEPASTVHLGRPALDLLCLPEPSRREGQNRSLPLEGRLPALQTRVFQCTR